MAERIIQIDSVDAYNKLYGWETLHPLVTVVSHAEPMASNLNHSRLNYGLYALFLKQGDGCSIRYGREKYDYQEGTVVSFKPGQVVEVEWDESRLYCRHHLHKDTIPEEYQHLADFACRRLDHCKYGEQKTACKDCPTHCYAPKEREAIREVMRWAGPRMIWYAPKDAILHILKK